MYEIENGWALCGCAGFPPPLFFNDNLPGALDSQTGF